MRTKTYAIQPMESESQFLKRAFDDFGVTKNTVLRKNYSTIILTDDGEEDLL